MIDSPGSSSGQPAPHMEGGQALLSSLDAFPPPPPRLSIHSFSSALHEVRLGWSLPSLIPARGPWQQSVCQGLFQEKRKHSLRQNEEFPLWLSGNDLDEYP